MTEEEKYLKVLSCETLEELQEAMTCCAQSGLTGDFIMGKSRPFSLQDQLTSARLVIKKGFPANLVTRSYGLRRQAMYIRLYEEQEDEMWLEDSFVVVDWPDIQQVSDAVGFDDNALLINEEPLLTEYGSSAYMVRKSWLEEIFETCED